MLRKFILIFIGFFIVAVCLTNCKNKSYKNKKYKETYDSAGKLEITGWYIDDTVPVDTIRWFYANGNIASIEIRDDSGHLNGPVKLYYESGEFYQLSNYINDSLEGVMYKYYKNGKRLAKFFFLNNKPIGDSYWYDDDGNISLYHFIDFYGHTRNVIKWDSLGNMINNQRQRVFYDSVRSYKEVGNKDKEYSDYVRVIISNPPKYRTVVRIDYISRNGVLMQRDSAVGVPYYFRKDRFMDTLGTIEFSGIQYDSLTGKRLLQTNDVQLYDEK
jgi:antitoxin component YwqK of YwqJK toxin-antitoxin module